MAVVGSRSTTRGWNKIPPYHELLGLALESALGMPH